MDSLQTIQLKLDKLLPRLKFRKDVEIDIYNLELEWLRQAILIYDYSKYLALLERKRDLLEVGQTVVAAEADGRARKVLKKGDKQPTVDQVRHYIAKKLAPGQQVIDSVKFEIKNTVGALKALDHKKRALEKLAELYLANYYAEPTLKSQKAKEAMRERLDRKEVDGRSKQLSGMKKKLKKKKVN